MEGRKGGPADEVNGNRSIYRDGRSVCIRSRNECYSHHEDNEGGLTIREYIEVTGTEKAYDSGRCIGRSMSTASRGRLDHTLRGV